MFSNLRGSEWLILILLIVLLFGARRLPDAARGLGRSLRIFKAETKGLGDQGDDAKQTEGETAQAVSNDAPAAAVEQTSASTDPAPAPAEGSSSESGKPAQS